MTALNIEADERPTAGPVSNWRAASAKPQGTIGPVPTPMSANPDDARAKALLRADEREARRRDRERRDDDVEVADAGANGVGIAKRLAPPWQIAKNAAPSPDTAASSGASSRSSSVDHKDAASSAAIETPMTTPSFPISGSANESPWRAGPSAATRGGGSPRAARSGTATAPAASRRAASTPAAQGAALAATASHPVLRRGGAHCRAMAKLPLIPVPSGVRFQPVDTGEVADRLIELADACFGGLAPDFAGPTAYPMAELIRSYLQAFGRRRPQMPVHLPGKTARAVKDGANLPVAGVIPGHRTGRSSCPTRRPRRRAVLGLGFSSPRHPRSGSRRPRPA